MAKSLGQILKDARNKKGMSLRKVEEYTGIHNAHLSQIENDTIARPDIAMLWSLASLYELDYQFLLRKAGYGDDVKSSGRQRQRTAAALRAMGELTAGEQNDVLRYMADLRSKRRDG